jgi:hypothetical protein
VSPGAGDSPVAGAVPDVVMVTLIDVVVLGVVLVVSGDLSSLLLQPTVRARIAPPLAKSVVARNIALDLSDISSRYPSCREANHSTARAGGDQTLQTVSPRGCQRPMLGF